MECSKQSEDRCWVFALVQQEGILKISESEAYSLAVVKTMRSRRRINARTSFTSGGASRLCPYWFKRSKEILSKPIDLQKRRDELKARRESLFNKYLKNPEETQLALEIKVLDDEVAECVQQMGRGDRKAPSES